jgi:uncharacterized protein (DUF362 family)
VRITAMNKIITRRDFMKKSAAAAITIGYSTELEAPGKTRVVLIRDRDLYKNSSKPDADRVKEMLERAVMALTGTKNPGDGFRKLVRPGDTIGIKSNQWAYMPTPPQLEYAIKENLLKIGVKNSKISIDDRGVLNNRIFMNSDSLINTRPLRTHYWSGIGGCIKNLIMFSPRPWSYHSDSCADLGLLLKLPEVKGKLKLNILSVFTPMFHGKGPHHFDRRYIWNYNGLIAGEDAVAVDAVGLALIRAKRREHFGKEMKFQTIPKHVEVADRRHGLGVSDLNRIELVKIGWKKNILI